MMDNSDEKHSTWYALAGWALFSAFLLVVFWLTLFLWGISPMLGIASILLAFAGTIVAIIVFVDE